ncbi:MAG: exo-alpha-sialidase [Acidobacteria bacterium]|nr:exo-alpha-sialidase [Acidobacteriota bacterium]
MPTRILLPLLAVALVAVTASCGRTTNPAEWTMTLQRVMSPAGASSSEPQIIASDRGLVLSWVERVGTTSSLKFAERTGSGWSTPMTAASGDDWFLSYADVPSVMQLGNDTLVAQWLKTTDPRTEGYDLLLSYSTDNGKTWAPPFTPHHDGTRFQHGFASLVELPGNTVGVLWLDGRNSEFLDNDPDSGSMTLRYAAFDSAWKQVADVDIDHKTCECCQTAAAVTADGVLTAYRDRDNDEVRDIGVSRLEGGTWTPATIVARDNWKIDFCPVNGPSLAARGRDAVVAWFTVKNERGQAYAAFSNDAGRTWGMPIRLDDAGSLGRVDVELLDDGSAIASWVEFAEGASSVRIRRIDRTGARSMPITVAGVTGGRASGFPRMGLRGNELVIAWSDSGGGEDGQLQVQTAVGQIP